jgi:hypothetical protein
MYKFILSILLLIPFATMSQAVAITTDGSNPDNSSILDIKSTTKGLLIPRLTTLQRTSIAGPAIGLTVFDTNTFSYWMYRGDVNGGWAEMQHSFQNFWTGSGGNIFNSNLGNVGIGTNAPGEKLSINGTNAAIQLMNSGTPRGFLQTNNTDIRLGTYANNTTGNLVFSTKAVDRMWVDENGRVGIGTATPASLLTLNGTNPYLQLQHNDVNTGFVQAVGVNLKVGTNSTNTTGNLVFQTKLVDRMMIDENGQVGIGTTSPTSILSINSLDPIVQFKNNGVDKGFVQLVGDDIRIGTNLSNTTGSFIVRTKGVDRLSIDETGDGVFGNGTSGGNLTMNGPVTSGLTLQSGNLAQGHIKATQDALEIYRTNPGIIRIRSNGDGMYFLPNGQISIGGGGKTATGYVVSIEGKAIAAEFRVLAPGSWPDYVFADNYKLNSLSYVKNFIAKNKHLPNIPAAAEMEKNGIELGDMTKRLMEKVEELTLYIIQLQEQVDELKKKNESKPGN